MRTLSFSLSLSLALSRSHTHLFLFFLTPAQNAVLASQLSVNANLTALVISTQQAVQNQQTTAAQLTTRLDTNDAVLASLLAKQRALEEYAVE